MALNLSTLTSPSNSSVLEEVNTTADFLEPCPVLRNLSRGSNKGGDAKQDVALNQPKALPLIDGDGYLYVSGVTGNYASIPHDSSLNLTNQLEVVARVKYRSYTGPDAQTIIAKWAQGDFNFRFSTQGKLEIFHKDSSNTTHGIASFEAVSANNISDGDTIWVKATIDATTTTASFNFYSSKDNVKNESDVSWTALGATKTTSTAGGIFSAFNSVVFGAVSTAGNDDLATGAVLKANYKAAIGGTPVLDVDFTATNVRHGDTKFKCATGQVVTINQAGNDPATIIKKPVLRFANKSDNSTNISLSGLLNQVITDGYMFAAFSVLGDGGESFGRIFGLNATGGIDSGAGGVAFRRNGTTTGLMIRYNEANTTTHSNLFDDERGDYLLDVKVQSGSQQSKANNADLVTGSVAGQLNAEEFSVASFTNGIANNPAIDLEFLALFSAESVPDEATASKIRNYINNRNNVFSLVDNGYYFFDPQKADFTGNFTDANTLDGYITGSDNGDTDVRTDLTLVQATLNDQPSTDGYTITFNDAAEHLEFENSASQNLSGWQIVGTSRGTFAYRVNNTAVTELNLLGNLGNVNQRKTGSLYGVILIPESATGRDIEEARKLLIDRGSADASPTTSGSAYWASRTDIVEFKNTDFPNVVSLSYAWDGCNNMTQIGTLNAPVATTFSNAWKSCSALTSFPANAKLGTAANNVNFSNAWESSGLTSFSTPLPTASICSSSWWGCTSLASFNTQLPQATNARFAFYNNTSLSDFKTTDIKNCADFTSTWQNCSALTSFPAGAKLGTEASSGVNFGSAWQSSGLTSFPSGIDLSKGTTFTNAWRSTDLISFNTPLPNGTVFYAAWRDCTDLESFSSEINGSNVRYGWYECSSLTSFSVPLSNANRLDYSWRNCASLTDFSADVFANWNPSSLVSGIFDNTWKNTALTAASVENILVGINNSGKYATSTGASGGSALGNAGIDIDYDGTTLSAATNAAVTSLKSKGWVIVVNNVTL